MSIHQQIGFASINGAELYHEVVGTGEPTLAFIHAGICYCRQWDEQMAYFAPRHRVIRFDSAGYGQSPLAVRPVDMHRADMAALLDQLGIGKVVLVGCSRGGALALDYTLEHPDRVIGLVLLGSALNGFKFENPEPEPDGWAEIVQAWNEGNFEPANEHEIKKFVDGAGQPTTRVDAAVRAKAAAMNLIALQNERLAEAHSIQPEPQLEPAAAVRLSEIRVPVLLMVGQYDTSYVHAAAAVMMADIPSIQRIDMPTAHLPNMEMSEAFNRHVEDFLKSL